MTTRGPRKRSWTATDGEALREQRNRRGLSQQEIAEAVGCTPSRISELERAVASGGRPTAPSTELDQRIRDFFSGAGDVRSFRKPPARSIAGQEDADEFETLPVGDALLRGLEPAITASLMYEKTTRGKRKLGITGEVGELLVCRQLGLKLVLDSRSKGFDAIDKDGLRVEIKSRRSESGELPRDAGRTSRFSPHPFDYALLGLLDPQYRLREIWRADYDKLKPLIDKQKRRNPNLSLFKRVGRKVFDSTE